MKSGLIALGAVVSSLLAMSPQVFAALLGSPFRLPLMPYHSAGVERSSWMAPGVRNTKEPLLYVADTYDYAVVIYKQRGRDQQPVGKITADITFPYGVWVDTHRNLWVANVNTETESTILRFPQGSTTPDIVLGDPNWNAGGVWVSREGDVYVVNNPYSGNSQILEYPRHRTPARVVGDPNLELVDAVVGDAQGDLFASGLGASGGEVDERPAGSTKWQNTGIPASEPAGLAFDGAGNFIVADIGPDIIETFPPGQTKPSNTIECTAQCWAIAFNRRGTILWADEVNDLSGSIDEFTYPGGKLLQSLPQGASAYTLGVATTPNLDP